MIDEAGLSNTDTVTTRHTRAKPSIIAIATSRHYSSDLIAYVSLLVVATAAVVLRMVYDNWLAEPDLITFFIPWFGFIGDSLRAGDLPIWSSNYLGGIPVIGSPSSGWLYLPVMVIFPFFEVVTAFKTMILVQVLIGGTAAYVLARRVDLQPIAAFAAAAAFVLGPLIYESTRFTMVGSQVTTWIPVGLVGADLALGARRPSALVGWSALVGVAMSQMIVAWPGQGILYGAMWIGAWMFYRTAFAPLDQTSTLLFRFWQALKSGIVMTVVAFGLSAAALLPVLNISQQSTIPDGDYSQVLGGDYASIPHVFKILLYYMLSGDFNIRAEGFGAGIITLALFGALLAGRRHAALFFSIVLLVGLSLTVENSPTRPILDLIPGFAHFHGHRPIAIVWTLSLAPAMLVGAAVQMYIHRRHRPISQWLVLGVLMFCVLLVTQVNTLGSWIGWSSFLPMIIVVSIFGAASLRIESGRRITAHQVHVAGLAGLIGVILMFPTGYDAIRTIIWPESPEDQVTKYLGKDDFTSNNVETVLSRTDPGTAAEFLQQQQDLLAPFRFTSYSSQGYPTPAYQWIYNTYWFRRMEPNVVGLLVNARTLRLGLEQTSGYNPVQIKNYVTYINVMNAAQQDYHWSDTYASALTNQDNQLLDMLNVRYILVDIAIPVDREDHAAIRQNYQEVFRDDHVIVYENAEAFPRAWIAHSVYENFNGVGLALLDSGQVDGHNVAYVDGGIPELLQDNDVKVTGNTSTDQVTIVDQTQDSMKLEVSSEQDGLLVVSATYTDGWVAYIDGRKTDVLRTNQAFQGVAMPAGNHLVELRYEPQSLEIGLYTSGVTAIGVLAIWSWALADLLRQRGKQRPEERHQPVATIGDTTETGATS